MVPKWHDPFNITEWLKRFFSFFNLLIFLFTLLLFFSEFRFDWIEKMVGSYLITTNEQREEKGLIWKTGKQATSAHEYLDTIISKKESALETVNRADTFSQLAKGILPGEWVPLESQTFKSMYLALEPSLAVNIIEPAHLVRLLNTGSLNRIFCEGVQSGLNIYFTDSQNRVIKKIVLDARQMMEIEAGVRPVAGRLEDIPGFSGRIYPAALFFEALLTIPADILPDLISHPDILLKQDKKIVRVGIWNESKNGYIRLGFEIQENGNRQVVLMNSREWAVWQLTLNLKGEAQ